jgi:hypothetical protein
MTNSTQPVRQFITPTMLAARWNISTKTLANNRTRGIGLPFVKVGGSIRYPLDAVEEYEAANTVQSVA